MKMKFFVNIRKLHSMVLSYIGTTTLYPIIALTIVICANILFIYLLIHKDNYTKQEFIEYLFLSVVFGPCMLVMMIFIMFMIKIENRKNLSALNDPLV